MYERNKPKWVDARITQEQYEKLMEISAVEADSAYSFGSPHDHFNRAVLSAARVMLDGGNVEKFTPLKQAVEALYYAAYWASDRLSSEEEKALWTAVRDAAGLAPGDSFLHLGPSKFA